MPVNKSNEWKIERHKMLNEYLEIFCINAHKILDLILEHERVDDNWFIIGDSSQVLPQTVMNIVCSQCKCKPNSKQNAWSGELLMLKKALK